MSRRSSERDFCGTRFPCQLRGRPRSAAFHQCFWSPRGPSELLWGSLGAGRGERGERVLGRQAGRCFCQGSFASTLRTGLLGELQLSNGLGGQKQVWKPPVSAVAASPVIPWIRLSWKAFFRSCMEILLRMNFPSFRCCDCFLDCWDLCAHPEE